MGPTERGLPPLVEREPRHSPEKRARFAYALRAAMDYRELSIPELATLVERATETIYRWRTARTLPSVLDIMPLADALDVDPSLFLDPPPIPDYPLEHYLKPRT
jgi:transcriptional regulator with XRE-family HTH domain